MKNKGFTLVELLIVITILGMLALIAVPTIQSVIDKNNKNMCNGLKESIESSAYSYVTENKYELLWVSSCSSGSVNNTITLETLISKNYLKSPVKNPVNKSDIDIEKKVTLTYDCDKKSFSTSFDISSICETE